MTREEFIDTVKDTGTKVYGEVTVLMEKLRKQKL